jgi:transposase
MRLYIGIDWSEQKHDICMMNEAGAILKSWPVAHPQDGFLEVVTAIQELGVEREECCIGIETAYNLVVDSLSGWGYSNMYVMPPSAVKAGRQRYRQAPARTDQTDAWLIANLLRVDQPLYHRWQPNLPLTMQIAAQVNLILKLTRQAQRYAEQLRATLLRYYPAILQTFRELDSATALKFIASFPNPAAAQALTFTKFEAFARQNRFNQPLRISQAYLRLQLPQPETSPEVVAAFQPIALSWVDLLQHTLAIKKTALSSLTTLYLQHPDQPIYGSLPGAGPFLEPALLSKLGDQRSRFPTPHVLQAIAGTCPVTDSSGKMRHILFRKACDHDFRYIVQTWARGSIRKSSWARLYFSEISQRSKSNSHAYRCLANRWLAILWKLWQDGCPYDETLHLRNRLLRARPRVIQP